VIVLTNPAPIRAQAKARLLIVGDIAIWQRAGRRIPASVGVQFANLSEVTTCFLHTISLEIVISPVIGQGYDAIDVAAVLANCGYRGRYRCLADCLPNLDLIRQEVAMIAPDLDFEIVRAADLAI